MKILVVVSGGVDSITLAYLLKSEGNDITFLTFDYGQKHRKEIECARYHADLLNAEMILLDMSFLGDLLISSLTSNNLSIPLGGYNKENISSTVVPNRNSIMINIAYGIAISGDYDTIGLGMHSGDHYLYPDCRPEFIEKTQAALVSATNKFIKIYIPFINKTKGDIMLKGFEMGVDYERTWSCYKGLEKPCNKCATCLERNEAMKYAKEEFNKRRSL